eukprot:14361280-Ditylum_brightwellii.AAC.1
MPNTLNMTSFNNNSFEGQEVCFEVKIGETVKKGSNLYKVNWNYTEGNPSGSNYRMDVDKFGDEVVEEKIDATI